MVSDMDRLRMLLEQLSEEEFREASDLYREEDARRRRLAALSFRKGDRVRFETDKGVRVAGAVERINVKTVTVQADDGRSWRVAPQILEIEPKAPPDGRVAGRSTRDRLER